MCDLSRNAGGLACVFKRLMRYRGNLRVQRWRTRIESGVPAAQIVTRRGEENSRIVANRMSSGSREDVHRSEVEAPPRAFRAEREEAGCAAIDAFLRVTAINQVGVSVVRSEAEASDSVGGSGTQMT